jgi:hypothetical protein
VGSCTAPFCDDWPNVECHLHHISLQSCSDTIPTALSGLVVSVLSMIFAAVGSGLAEDGGFLWVIKSVACTSFEGEVMPSVSCHRFTAYERTLQSMSEMLCQPNFMARYSPEILLLRYCLALVESGWFKCVCWGCRLATYSSFALTCLWNRVYGNLRPSGL